MLCVPRRSGHAVWWMRVGGCPSAHKCCFCPAPPPPPRRPLHCQRTQPSLVSHFQTFEIWTVGNCNTGPRAPGPPTHRWCAAFPGVLPFEETQGWLGTVGPGCVGGFWYGHMPLMPLLWRFALRRGWGGLAIPFSGGGEPAHFTALEITSRDQGLEMSSAAMIAQWLCKLPYFLSKELTCPDGRRRGPVIACVGGVNVGHRFQTVKEGVHEFGRWGGGGPTACWATCLG